MVMGCPDGEMRLDSSMLKFVEPLGPAQMVDRQSLVILPQGYLKVSFETQPRRLLLRVHSFRQHLSKRERHSLRTVVRTFYSIRNHVLEGKSSSTGPSGAEDADILHVFDKAVMMRLAFGEQGSKPDEPVREVIQICVYRGRNRAFLGLIHVAVDELLAQACDGDVTHGWYKIFPRSSFSPGCPIACITPHCVNPCPTITRRAPPLHSRMGKHATFPADLYSSGAKEPEQRGNSDRSTAARLTTYSRVVGVCQALTRRVQVRKSQPNVALPVTIDLKMPETLTSSTSSSSIDVGYGSSGSSHSARDGARSPALLDLSSSSAATDKQMNLFRRLSTRTPSSGARASVRRNRRSFNVGDTFRFNQTKPTSTIRRSEEVIATHAGEHSPNDDHSGSGSSSCSHSGSQRRIGFCESYPEFFFSTANESAASVSVEETSGAAASYRSALQRSKSVPRERAVGRSVSVGGAAQAMTEKRDRTTATRKQSLKKIVRGLSRRRKDRESVTSVENGGEKKKRSLVKASLSFPPDSCADEQDDNVYEVLLKLKKMSVDQTATPSFKASPVASPRRKETTSAEPPVVEITEQQADAEQGRSSAALRVVAHNNNNPCRKGCTKRAKGKLRQSPDSAASGSVVCCKERRNEAELSQRRTSATAVSNSQDAGSCESDDNDEYLSCNDDLISANSSYASLREGEVAA